MADTKGDNVITSSRDGPSIRLSPAAAKAVEEAPDNTSNVLALSIDKASVGAACLDIAARSVQVSGALLYDRSMNDTLAWVQSVLQRCRPDLVVVSTKVKVSRLVVDML